MLLSVHVHERVIVKEKRGAYFADRQELESFPGFAFFVIAMEHRHGIEVFVTQFRGRIYGVVDF